MSETTPSREPASSRKEDILQTAATLFRRHGYQDVGIDDIGAAVGISGPAIYRHFAGKQALLLAVIRHYVERLHAQWLDLGGHDDPHAILEAAIQSSIDEPDAYFVYATQRVHLEVTLRPALEDMRVEVRDAWGTLLTSMGTTRGSSDRTLRLTALQGAMIHLTLTNRAGKRIRTATLKEVAYNILRVPLPTPASDAPPRRGSLYKLQHVNRRAAVLAAATRLFRDNGFNTVTLKDIGDAVGVSASAIHRHFSSKEEILHLVLTRGTEQIGAVIDIGLRNAATADEAVTDMASRLSTLYVESNDLFSINFNLLPPTPGRITNRKANVEEVASKLADAHPDLTLAESRIRCGSMYSILGNVVRNDALLRRPGIVDELTTLCTATLRPTL